MDLKIWKWQWWKRAFSKMLFRIFFTVKSTMYQYLVPWDSYLLVPFVLYISAIDDNSENTAKPNRTTVPNRNTVLPMTSGMEHDHICDEKDYCILCMP